MRLLTASPTAEDTLVGAHPCRLQMGTKTGELEALFLSPQTRGIRVELFLQGRSGWRKAGECPREHEGLDSTQVRRHRHHDLPVLGAIPGTLGTMQAIGPRLTSIILMGSSPWTWGGVVVMVRWAICPQWFGGKKSG